MLHVLGIPSTIFLQCPLIIIDSFSGIVFLFHFLSTCAVAVVGGLMINRRIGGDFFQPLSSKLCTNDSKHIDLFETTFGERPSLVPILGSEEAVEKLFVGGRGGVGGGRSSMKK